MSGWSARAQALRDETRVLYHAYRDPRVPWYARVYVAVVLAYLFSPIDLIPDIIPVLGYLDELLLMPAFVAIARRLIPAGVLAESRQRVMAEQVASRPVAKAGAVVIVVVWMTVAIVTFWLLSRVSEG